MPINPTGGQWIQGRPGTAELSSPGRVVKLAKLGDSDTIDARCDDPLINEWVIVVQPSVESINLIKAGQQWDVTMTVQLWHDSAKFVYFRSIFNPDPKPVPVVGITLGVHGQRVRVGLYKGNTDAPQPFTIDCAVIPRPPSKSTILEGPFPVSVGVPAVVPIPSMAREVRVIGGLTPGDYIRFLFPDGFPGIGDINMSDPLLGIPLPISPAAGFIRYVTADPVGKLMWFEFETWF